MSSMTWNDNITIIDNIFATQSLHFNIRTIAHPLFVVVQVVLTFEYVTCKVLIYYCLLFLLSTSYTDSHCSSIRPGNVMHKHNDVVICVSNMSFDLNIVTDLVLLCLSIYLLLFNHYYLFNLHPINFHILPILACPIGVQ
jgi:hypothetical protein